MVSSGPGMFGEAKFTSFCEWFSGLPRSIYPKDFLYAQGEQMCWLYVYDETLEIPQGFDIIDFEGGLYSVATDIDLQTDTDEMVARFWSFWIKTVLFPMKAVLNWGM